MSVQINNVRGDGLSLEQSVVSVEDVVGVSRFWRCERVGNEKGIAEGSKLEKMKVGWQEQVTMHFLLKPVAQLVAASAMSGNSKNFNLQFMGLEAAASRTTEAKKKQLKQIRNAEGEEHLPKSIQEIRREAQNREAEEEEEENKEKGKEKEAKHQIEANREGRGTGKGKGGGDTSLAAMVRGEASVVNLSIVWRSSGGEIDRFGQHHATNIIIQPTHKEGNGHDGEGGCPLHLCAEYDTDVTFVDDNKNNNNITSTSFNIVVSNRNTALPIKFKMLVGNGGCDSYDIVGVREIECELEGMGHVTIPERVVFHEPGNFNLQQIKLEVGGCGYTFSFPWWVRVHR